MEKISISRIDATDNFRSRMKKTDLGSLMVSMENTGQLQPIGVRREGRKLKCVFGHRRLEAAKKLGWKKIGAIMIDSDSKADSMVKQTVENLHREQPSVTDFGYSISRLKSEGLTDTEISAKLGINPITVKQYYDTFQDLNSKGIKVRVYKRSRGNDKKGRISGTEAIALSKILRTIPNLTKADKDNLVEYAKTDNCNSSRLRLVGRLVSKGNSIDKAKKLADSVKRFNLNLMVQKTQVRKIESEWEMKFSDVIKEILTQNGITIY